MVIFAGENFAKTLARHSRGGNFHDITHSSFIQAYRCYFRVGVIFAKKTKTRKTRKLPPRENFHVYSIYFVDTYLHFFEVLRFRNFSLHMTFKIIHENLKEAIVENSATE